MSFYSSLWSGDRVRFSFDKIYPNRAAMEDAASAPGGDEVFAGRFVLVKYDIDGADRAENLSADNDAIFTTDYSYLQKNYDATVWQKKYEPTDNEANELIACLQHPFHILSHTIQSIILDDNTGYLTFEVDTHESYGGE